jgi:hypothetical protein
MNAQLKKENVSYIDVGKLGGRRKYLDGKDIVLDVA